MDRDIRSKSSLKIFKLKIDYRSKENRDVRDIITAWNNGKSRVKCRASSVDSRLPNKGKLETNGAGEII